MHFNEVECFFFYFVLFQMLLHTEYTAKLYLNTVTLTEVWGRYFQVYSPAT